MNSKPIHSIPLPRIQYTGRHSEVGVLLNEDEVFDSLENNPFWIQFAWLRYTLQVHKDSSMQTAFLDSKRFIAWARANSKEVDDLVKTLTRFENRQRKIVDIKLSVVDPDDLLGIPTPG